MRSARFHVIPLPSSVIRSECHLPPRGKARGRGASRMRCSTRRRGRREYVRVANAVLDTPRGKARIWARRECGARTGMRRAMYVHVFPASPAIFNASSILHSTFYIYTDCPYFARRMGEPRWRRSIMSFLPCRTESSRRIMYGRSANRRKNHASVYPARMNSSPALRSNRRCMR